MASLLRQSFLSTTAIRLFLKVNEAGKEVCGPNALGHKKFVN
jgi:hypothetical protein